MKKIDYKPITADLKAFIKKKGGSVKVKYINEYLREKWEITDSAVLHYCIQRLVKDQIIIKNKSMIMWIEQ